jgi:hypothetical protein
MTAVVSTESASRVSLLLLGRLDYSANEFVLFAFEVLFHACVTWSIVVQMEGWATGTESLASCLITSSF